MSYSFIVQSYSISISALVSSSDKQSAQGWKCSGGDYHKHRNISLLLIQFFRVSAARKARVWVRSCWRSKDYTAKHSTAKQYTLKHWSASVQNSFPMAHLWISVNDSLGSVVNICNDWAVMYESPSAGSQPHDTQKQKRRSLILAKGMNINFHVTSTVLLTWFIFHVTSAILLTWFIGCESSFNPMKLGLAQLSSFQSS